MPAGPIGPAGTKSNIFSSPSIKDLTINSVLLFIMFCFAASCVLNFVPAKVIVFTLTSLTLIDVKAPSASCFVAIPISSSSISF
jgi:hypothetical protein